MICYRYRCCYRYLHRGLPGRPGRVGRGRQRPRRALAAAVVGTLAAALVAGCGGDTGLLIQVTRDAQSTPAGIDHLHFYVGVVDPNSPTTPKGFVAETAPSDLVGVSGRDLAADPYRLMLRPGDNAGDTTLVAVIGLKSGHQVGFGSTSGPVQFQTGKVLTWSITLVGKTRAQVSKTGCIRWAEDGSTQHIASPTDHDCDGDPLPGDCNDENPNVGPSKPEICGNGIDDNCNGKKDEAVDADHDGFTNCGGDCDDSDPNVHPGAPEICDGKDDNCDGLCDNGFDKDGDHYTTCGTRIRDDGTCEPGGPNPDLADCDDNDPNVHPGAPEICDGKDDNCNGQCDEGFDKDGDMYTTCGSRTDVCDGTSPADVDCNDSDPDVHPGAPEICDGKDDNCDGKYFPTTTPCYATDSAGACRVGTRTCDDMNGGGYTSECQVTLTNPAAAPSLCTAYSQCESMGAPDPFVCANRHASATDVACQLFYSNDTGQMCANTTVTLPDSGTNTTCTWLLPNGRMQTHYVVTLSAGTMTGAEVQSCAASLEITQARDQPPQADAFLLSHVADATSQLFRLNVTPSATSVCPQQGLVCTFPTP